MLRDILPKNLPAIAAALACINPNTIVDLISRMEAAARTMQFAQERADKEDEGLMIERIALGLALIGIALLVRHVAPGEAADL